jgi:hypothetical protein
VGRPYQGRFTAILVEREAHLLELIRYVVLNPVGAGFVRSSREWKWSSFRAIVGLAPAPPWLESGWTLEQFGRRDRRRSRGIGSSSAWRRAVRVDPGTA